MRAWIGVVSFVVLVSACGGGGSSNASSIEGVWYGDDGQTVLIDNGRLTLQTGELVASVEQIDTGAMRYSGPAGPENDTVSLVLQVEFPTPLRMTWTRLDGQHFRELTRVADVE
jgi:hypothetical protein